MRTRRILDGPRVFSGWEAVVILTMLGCGPPATIVTGVVKLDGQPVPRAIVDLTPERGDLPTATAQTDDSGRYSVRLSAVPYRAGIKAQRSTGRTEVLIEGGKPTEIYEDVLPARYADPTRSQLRIEPVDGKRTTADFELSTTP